MSPHRQTQPSINAARILWAEVNGEEVRVDDPRVPETGATYRCLGCQGELVPKQGQQNAWHFAHKSRDSLCVFSSNESARHYNWKMHIAQALRKGTGPLRVAPRCPWRRHPGDVEQAAPGEPRVWVHDWDDVQVERPLGNTRPDITLLRGGKPVALIEVVAHHPINPSKEERLRAHGHPWIEVFAHRSLPRWTPESPLEANKIGPSDWLCPGCEARAKTLRAQAELWIAMQQAGRALFVQLADLARRRSARVTKTRRYEHTRTSGKSETLRLEYWEAHPPDTEGPARVLVDGSDSRVLCWLPSGTPQDQAGTVFRSCVRNWRNERTSIRSRIEAKGPWRDV